MAEIAVRRIVELDSGRVESCPQPVRPRDLLAPVFAAAGSRLRQAGSLLESVIPAMLPHVQMDPQHAREALSLILDRLAGRAQPGSVVRVEAGARRKFVRLRIEEGSLTPHDRFPLAQRLLRLQGAETTTPADGALEILLPPCGELRLNR